MTEMSDRILYIDPYSGASGDMFLGAMLSVGVPLDLIADAVNRVVPGEVKLESSEVKRGGIACSLCKVTVSDPTARRTMPEMRELFAVSGMPGKMKDDCLGVLALIGAAEGRAHGQKEAVHLHELGGQDTIADIVGTIAAVRHLAPGRIVCGPVNLGRGCVDTEHGTLPVPAPATALILEGVPVFSAGPEMELTTPTGAALIRYLASEFAALPELKLQSAGMGAGAGDSKEMPNALRVFLGTGTGDPQKESVLIECGIDDVSPEYLAPLFESLYAKGAREVFMIPAHTKKGRMGVLLRVLVPTHLEGVLTDAVLEGSGSAGLRYWRVDRRVLDREVVKVMTTCGSISVKRWRMPSGKWRAKVEFEDVKELAGKNNIRPERLRDEAMAVYLMEFENEQE